MTDALSGMSGTERPRWRRRSRAVAVPLAVAVLATAAAPGIIRIEPGDSLWLLARRHGTTVDALKRLNGLPGDTIYAGRTLLVPGPGGRGPGGPGAGAARAAAGPAVRHRVRPGDTASGLALRYRSTVPAIVARNRLDGRATIRIGQVLLVPTAVAARVRRSAVEPAPRRYPRSVTEAADRHRWLLQGRPAPDRGYVRELIRSTARRLGVDQALALAVAQQESGFQQNVVSPADAIGVMQVLPSTGEWVSGAVVGRQLDLLDVRDNVLAGVALLGVLTRAAPLPAAVAGYYQGLASVRQRGMYPDTRQYVRNVLLLRDGWR